MDGYYELKNIISETAKGHINAAMVWATVKEVDWDKKEMTATGLTDGLDYYEVLLGLGGRYVKPKQDSKVLLGVIEDQAQHTILVYADEVEEEIIKVGELIVEIKNNKLMLENSGQNFKTIIDSLVDQLKNAIIQTPAGPGNFSPADVQAFEQIKSNINELLQ